MNMICIKELGKTTIGKTYEVREYKDHLANTVFHFTDDVGIGSWKMKERKRRKEGGKIKFSDYFIPLDQWREQQLKQLGI